MSTFALVNLLKENNQDHEFYPTTKEIITALYRDITKIEAFQYGASLLDVGCGNGKLFKTLEEMVDLAALAVPVEARQTKRKFEKYGIEKSEILISHLPDDVIIVGTDFFENTLIDKKVDLIFSNPPYSQFESWTIKIIREAYAKAIYLVIPQRWQESQAIHGALKSRDARFEVIGSFDFLESEDRQARAKVDLIRIDLVSNAGYYHHRREASDPFDIWFEEEFKINCAKTDSVGWTEERKKRNQIKDEVVKGGNLIETLAEIYQKELNTLLTNYKKLGELDGELLKELSVSTDKLKDALKFKIKNLKNIFWKELFDNFDKITNKLTSAKRSLLLRTLSANTSIDFTVGNAYAVVIWVIKNANKYFNSQLTDLYLELSDKDNVRNYKSNQRTWGEDRWRYTKRDHSHYCLDYRLILQHRGCWGSYSRSDELERSTIEFINDISTVAKNLGFEVIDSLSSEWMVKAGTKFSLRMTTTNGETETFVECKIFKNNNIHFKFNQNFIKAFNIEAARLNGWIQSAQEAAEEFPEDCKVTAQEAGQFFKKNYLLICENVNNLLESSI